VLVGRGFESDLRVDGVRSLLDFGGRPSKQFIAAAVDGRSFDVRVGISGDLGSGVSLVASSCSDRVVMEGRIETPTDWGNERRACSECDDLLGGLP
jgi:hypothetical protein